jgi:hypothetical protein
MAKDPHEPCRPGQQAEHGSYQAALAGTVGPHQRRIRLAGELKTHLLDSQLLPTPNAQTLHQQHRIAICHGPKAWRRSATLRRITGRDAMRRRLEEIDSSASARIVDVQRRAGERLV